MMSFPLYDPGTLGMYLNLKKLLFVLLIMNDFS